MASSLPHYYRWHALIGIERNWERSDRGDRVPFSPIAWGCHWSDLCRGHTNQTHLIALWRVEAKVKNSENEYKYCVLHKIHTHLQRVCVSVWFTARCLSDLDTTAVMIQRVCHHLSIGAALRLHLDALRITIIWHVYGLSRTIRSK